MASQSRDIEDIEILVHIAAPSKTTDDARYRQLAQAYLSFEPRSRTDLSNAQIVHGNHGKEHAWAPASGQQDSLSARPESEPRPSQSFIPESQDLSFDGALDNCSSPPLRKVSLALPDNINPPSPSKSWESLPSHVSDSYPMPDARLFHTTPARVLERCFQGFAESTDFQEPSSLFLPRDRAPSVELHQGNFHIPSSIPVPDSEDERDVSVNHHDVDSRKIIPVTPMAPGGLTRKRRDAFEPHDQTVIEKTYIPSSAISHISGSSSQRAESAPPPNSKRIKTGEASFSANLLRSSSDMGPARTGPTASPSTDGVHDLLEIRPPSPPAGVASIESRDIISEKLADLARDLSSRYRPRVKRQLDPFERGYWLLDCTGWTAETRVEAWQFLTNYLRSGLAGWGVWCRRDVAFSSMRLYCWGHVTKHTYLLLYLASGRHIKATGAEWFGADGELVLEVPPAER